MEVINPYNQEIVGQVQLIDSKDVDSIIQRASESRKACKLMSSKDKSDVLNEIISKIKKNYEIFVETICKESGKPKKQPKGTKEISSTEKSETPIIVGETADTRYIKAKLWRK